MYLKNTSNTIHQSSNILSSTFFLFWVTPCFPLTKMRQNIPTPCNLRRKLWQSLHLQYTRQLQVTVNRTKKSHSVHVVKANSSKHIQQFRVMEYLSYLLGINRFTDTTPPLSYLFKHNNRRKLEHTGEEIQAPPVWHTYNNVWYTACKEKQSISY